MQARSDTLKLGWRGLSEDKELACKLCKKGQIETLEHFLLDCPELQLIRNRIIFLQLPRPLETEKLMEIMLLYTDGEVSHDTIINTILCMWTTRIKTIAN